MAPKLVPGARISSFPSYVVQRLSGAFNQVFGGQPAPGNIADVTRNGQNIPQNEVDALEAAEAKATRIEWFGPGRPMAPTAPRLAVAGRRYDYPTSINLDNTPRAYEGISFATLRALSDGYDLVRLAIEKRKDQMAGVSWDFRPRMRPGQNTRDPEDERCRYLNDFFRRPDQKTTWDSWQRELLEEMFVTDAASIYVRRTRGGDIYGFELIDGATIIPRLDELGRRPTAPQTAFQQILKGTTAVDYSSDQLKYFPRNLRPGHIYGNSPVQQIYITLQSAIRREISKLDFWTAGNVPDAFMQMPDNWTPSQIQEFATFLDNALADPAQRRKIWPVPAANVQLVRPVQTLDPQQDEWLARLVAYAFNLPPTALVRDNNRSTAESNTANAKAEGLNATMVWLKSVIDDLVENVFMFPDIELVFEDVDDLPKLQVDESEMAEVRLGLLSPDEYRAKRGRPPIGVGCMIYGMGPQGVIPMSQISSGEHFKPNPLPPGAGYAALAGGPTPLAALGGMPAPPRLPPPQPASTNPPFTSDPSSFHGASAQKPQPPSATATASAIGAQGEPFYARIAPEITNAINSLPPDLLAAVGLEPDYGPMQRIIKAKGAVTPAVLAELKSVEKILKGGGARGAR
jgi:hypothetical protein